MKKIFFVLAILYNVVAQAQINVPHSIKVVAAEPNDWKQGPWATTTSAKTNVPLGLRKGGLTVYILSCSCEYWWLDTDLTDGGLILKQSATTLTNGNGTTANGSAVDLGGTVSSSILITGDKDISFVNNPFAGIHSSFTLGTNTLGYTKWSNSSNTTPGAETEYIKLGGGMEFFSAGTGISTGFNFLNNSGYFNITGVGLSLLGGQSSDTEYTIYGPRASDGALSKNTKGVFSNRSNTYGAGLKQIFGAPTSSFASVNFPSGTWPSSPSTGDFGYDGTHLYFKPSGSVVDLLAGGGGSTSLGTITADPFNYPASGNTLDVFGGRTRGNLQSVFGDYTLPVISVTNKLVIDGNSNGYGSLLADTSKRYGSVMRSILGTTNYGYHNFSVPGETTLQMTARQSTTNAAFDGGKTHNYLMAFEIENDAFINTSTTYTNLYNHMATWYTAAKAAGFYTIALTAPTRAYFGNSIPTSLSVNNKILKADSLLRITTTSYDTLLDIFTLPRLSNNRSSTGYTYDDTHFNPSGHDDIAHAGVSIIRKKLGQQDYTPPHFASWDGNTTGKSMIFGTKDSYPVGFITNGKVRGEFQTNGTFAINGNISEPDANTDPRYRFGVGSNQAIGLMVTAGLTAITNNAVLSEMTIQPSYFDVNGKTGVICDMLRLNKYKSNGYGNNVLRIDSAGRMTHAPSFTAANATDYALSFFSNVTGPASGNYTQNSFSSAFSFTHDGQTHISNDFAPTLTRGALTNTTEVTLNVNSGSGATGNDKAILVSAVDGEGIHIDHAGGGVGLNVSSTTSSGNIFAFNTGSGNAIINFKTTGTAVLQRNITNSSSNSSGLIDMASWERGSGSQTAGTGLSQYWTLVSDASNQRRAVQEDWYWVNNADGLENAGKKWNMFKRGVLTETMRLETDKLSLGTGAPGAILDIKPGGSAASSAPIKLNYNSITTTGASGTGTVATITFASQPKIPFEVGGTVTISGVTPSGYNGTYTVTAATLIAVSFTNSTTGSQTVAGIVETGMLTTPEAGAIERDKNHLYFTDSAGSRIQLDNQDTFTNTVATGLTTTHHLSGSGTISFSLGAGAGSGSPSFSVGSGSNDLSGQIEVIPGTSPTGSNATIFTITFATTYARPPFIVLTPGSNDAAALSGATQVYATSSTTTFILKSGVSALPAGDYIWFYHIIQ